MVIARNSRVTATQQLDFLRRTSRILEEGRFTTTYKFAMLIALTNIAVRRGRDDGSPLPITLDELAREFIDLHWGLEQPFPGVDGALLAFSNQRARQATVITQISRHAGTSRNAHARLRAYRASEKALVAKVRNTLTRDVLYRLQSVGPKGSEVDPPSQFIYEHPADAKACAKLKEITLKPGVSACLRALRPVIVSLAQARWALWMRAHNPWLGPDCALERFMFGSDRIPLAKLAEWLYDLQDGRCFYTGKRLSEPSAGHVDHFLPRARYALDLPANLVLASITANADKREHIASERFLKQWSTRNEGLTVPASLVAEARFGHRPDDATGWNSAGAVARWMYAVGERSQVPAWDGMRTYCAINGSWRSVLGTE
jgi:hypothetical protein